VVGWVVDGVASGVVGGVVHPVVEVVAWPATGDVTGTSPPVETASVGSGCPSHSRNEPHEPQNWSPRVLANPHRRHRTVGSSLIAI
jgi:hypothetical protein